MKTNKKLAKQLSVMFFALLMPLLGSAHDFEFDGIYYNITSSADHTVEVTYKGNSYNSYSGEYSGSITIPATVTYNGVNYSVTSIGDYAFYECESLTTITIPEGVTSIENWAFRNCSSLTAITIPKSVTSIEGSVFSDCSSLTSINVKEGNTVYDSRNKCNAIIKTSDNTLICGCSATIIPEGVTSIGNSAFDGRSNLKSITIPEGVTSIGNSAFENCSSLTSINIPSTVKSIGHNVFYGCTSLTSINIPKGITSIKNGTFRNCRSLTAINIPEGVTSIGDWAFEDCSSLTSINIPKSVTSIGDDAFNGCSSLYKVFNYSNLIIIAGSSKYGDVATNAKYVFQGNEISTEGNFQFHTSSDGVYSLINYLGEEKEIVLPNNYKGNNYMIGGCAFHACSAINSITIPKSVTSIGDDAFNECSSLTTINIPEDSQLTSIGSSAFSGCSSLTTINIPEDSQLTSIGSSAFYNCSSLTAITIPKSMTSIESNAFSGCIFALENFINKSLCTNSNYWGAKIVDKEYDGVLVAECSVVDCRSYVTSVTIPEGVTSIGDWAFSDCSSLTAINIPESVTSIGEYAFSYCTSLTSINIPKGITSIKNGTFRNCRSLTAINIPEGVTSIGDGAFSACSSLTTINIPENSQLTSIGDWAFSGCSSLTAITIPESVTSIGDWAFSGCSSLTSITIPEGVTSIGNQAFEDCSSLTSITIPESVTSIGSSVFTGCTGELKVNCDIPSASHYQSSPFYNSTFSKVTIGDKVTSIGDYAFYNCSNLTDINIPESVISIGYSAFYDTPWYNNQSDGVIYINNVLYLYKDTMSKDTSINVKEGTVSISPGAFYSCSSLTSINIPSTVKSIGRNVFYGCTSLTSINIPEGVTSIGRNVFYGCTSLTSINIPASVTFIGDYAFRSCSKLESVYINSIEAWCNIDFEITDSYYYANPLIYAKKLFLNDVLVTELVIPHSVAKIKDYAFYGFNGFTSITIGDGVRDIKQCQFYRGKDSRLEELTLGKGLKKIEAGAFTNSENLKKIAIYATQPPATDGYIFSSTTYENATLYVPQGCISKYQAMTGWSGFYNISEMEGGTPDYLTIRQADNGAVGIAVDMGRTYKVCITPSAGWKIHSVTFNGTDITTQLNDDNTLTTPTISGSSELVVAYEQVNTAIENARASRIKVQGHQGTLRVTGATEGTDISVYTTDGVLVTQERAEASETEVTLPTGQVYIVTVADTVVKIGM